MRHSNKCLTASKLIVPRCSASPMACSTSSKENVSNRRSTCTYSRLPFFLSRASSSRRRREKHSGNSQPTSGADAGQAAQISRPAPEHQQQVKPCVGLEHL